MKKELPIYKMIIGDTENTEVNFVSLVDAPAIERMWLKFNEHKEPLKFVADKERQILTGVLMVADLPIYRRDEKLGEYYVVFDKDNIEKAAQKFFKNGYNSNINIMHTQGEKVEGAYLFESFIVDKSRGISAPKGFEDVTEGTWIGSVKVENKDVWDRLIKSESLMGFSVEGVFGYELEMTEDEKTIQEIIKSINS